jgi:peptidylprolyl isomerase
MMSGAGGTHDINPQALGYPAGVKSQDIQSTFNEFTTIKLPDTTMNLRNKLIFGLTLAGTASVAYSYSSSSRRSFLNKSAVTAAVAVSAGVGPKAALAEDSDPYADYTTTESGLKYKVTKEGSGAVPSAGQTVKAHYTGWLDEFDSIRKFDSSRDRSRPFTFKAGAGQV